MGQFPRTSFGNSKNQKISKRKHYVLLYVHILNSQSLSQSKLH